MLEMQERRKMGTWSLGVVSVTPPCSSDAFKPAHLSFPSEICFYSFAKTFIYGSGQLAAGRAMCQWSWRMLNVWYGSAQTASIWFANIAVLCIYKAASERRGFFSKLLQHGRQLIHWGNSSIHKHVVCPFFLACSVSSGCSHQVQEHLSDPTKYLHHLLFCCYHHFHRGRNSPPKGFYKTSCRKPLQPPSSPAGCTHPGGAVPTDVTSDEPPAILQLLAPQGIPWRSRHPRTRGQQVSPHSYGNHSRKQQRKTEAGCESRYFGAACFWQHRPKVSLKMHQLVRALQKKAEADHTEEVWGIPQAFKKYVLVLR